MISSLAIIIMVIGSFMGAFASLFLKKGSAKFNFRITEQLKNYSLIIGITLYLIGSIMYIYALSLERLSALYPFTSLTYLWVALVSVKLLGEKMNKYKIIGIIMIIIGIVVSTYFMA